MENNTQEKFKQYLLAKRLSERTIKEYLLCFNSFELERLSQGYINEWLQSHNQQIPRAFLGHLIHYLKVSSPDSERKVYLAGLEIPKPTGRKKVRLKQFLSIGEVGQIEKHLQSERNKLMLAVSYYGALRVSELISIKPYDFNWKYWKENPESNGELKVIGKGNKQRKLYIPQPLMKRLYNWIMGEVSKRGQSKDEPLFQIKQSRWAQLLKEASIKALGKPISTHTIRRSFAQYLKEVNGFDLLDISHYLGHNSISTTQIYLGSSDIKLKEKFDKLFKEKEENQNKKTE